MSIETRFDIAFVAALALREKQLQQSYRPLIGVHKWFARRPGALFRSLLLAEYGRSPIDEAYYRSNIFEGLQIADPFMGGGTPLIEANRMGIGVIGIDVNPMSARIVREQIEFIDTEAYMNHAHALTADLARHIAHLYVTDCPHFGTRNVPVKYFLWVKVLTCEACGEEVDLFPGYLLAENKRHPKNVVICSHCGDLNEIVVLSEPGRCQTCAAPLKVDGPAKRSRCACPRCLHVNTYPRPAEGPPRHRLFAIEYFNPQCKDEHSGRFFKRPDAGDLARLSQAEDALAAMEPQYIPVDSIPDGDETRRLHRWGYRSYRDLFNTRQLVGLENSCRLIRNVSDRRMRRALGTNLSDLLRYQNMLCRYDTMALKSLDIFSIHGYPVGLVQCESNLLGFTNAHGVNVGSGGWTNIIEKYARAKRYCDAPFEVRHTSNRKVQVSTPGEWIGDRAPNRTPRSVELRCANAATENLPPASLDGVFTDPPYFGNVQYGELMDFCYVWLRQLLSGDAPEMLAASARSIDELTVNETAERGPDHFTEGLSATFRQMAQALKPGAPLVFTYHHNELPAYAPVGIAILDAGLTCLASIPCPAEMGASIHIRGTNSSIVDSVFVCRAEGMPGKDCHFSNAEELGHIVASELKQLAAGGVKYTDGDIRCICLGHITRMTVCNLRSSWDPAAATSLKRAKFLAAAASLGSLPDAAATAREAAVQAPIQLSLLLAERRSPYEVDRVTPV